MIKQLLEQYYGDVVRLRHELHRFPELGHREEKTTEIIRNYLRESGVEILDYPLKTGVVARIPGGAPGETLAIREDIDALPIEENTESTFASERSGISHACGHDIHTAALLLTARVLSEVKNRLCGTLLFIFQPAEETCDGAAKMLAAGVLKQHLADQLIGLHCSPAIPLGKTGVISGINNAGCDVVRIEIKGRAGHGAHPEECIDPIIAAGVLLTQMQTLISREISPCESAVLTFGQIAAGTAPNIIPEHAELYGTLRTLNPEIRDRLKEAIPRMADGCCKSMRASCRVVFEKGMPPLVNDPKLSERFAASSCNCLGKDSVVRLSVPSMGSDDFSCLLEQCKNRGGQFLIGTHDLQRPETGIGLHNGANVFPDEAIGYGAAVLCQYALDTLRRQE